MKTERNILIAFILNFSFSIFEFVGGIITGSVAIMSDSIHDIGDAVGIGVSYIFEKISHKKPNDKYTFGYKRLSVVGSLITTMILIVGSMVVVYNAIGKMISPTEINYNGMIVFAVVGVCVNFAAAFFTHEGHSLNEKAVNLHMLEDVFGWLVVLIGAVVIRFTGFVLIDPIMSLCVALFILIHAFKNLIESFELLVEKVPHDISVIKIRESVLAIDSVVDICELYIWSLDGIENYCIIKVELSGGETDILKSIKLAIANFKLDHITIEVVKGGNV